MNNYFVFIIQKSILYKNICLVNKKYCQIYDQNFNFFNVQLNKKLYDIYQNMTYDEIYKISNMYYRLIRKKKEKEKELKQKLSLNLERFCSNNFDDELMDIYEKNKIKYANYFLVDYNETGKIIKIYFNYENLHKYIFDQLFLQNITKNSNYVINVPEYINNITDLEFYIFNGRDDFYY